MIDNPLLHAQLIQVQQRLSKFTETWDAKKVTEVMEQRLTELRNLESSISDVMQKREEVFLQEKKWWDEEKKVAEDLFKHRVEIMGECFISGVTQMEHQVDRLKKLFVFSAVGLVTGLLVLIFVLLK